METRSYILPVLLASVVHLTVFVLIGSHWESTEPSRPRPPQHIEAKMIDLKALAERQQEQERIAQEQLQQAEQARQAERKKQEQAAEQRKQELAKRQAEAEAKQRAQQEAERKRQQEVARQKAAEQKRQADLAAKRKAEVAEQKRKADEQARKQAADAKRKAEAAAKAEAERKRQQQLAEAELQQALAREQRAREAASAQRVSQAVVGDIQAYIQAMLQDSWRIPSTARNGMEAVVAIHFLPSGEVDQAYIETSSGNAAFDNSAIQAVYRVQRFPRVAEIDPIMFERRLRRLLVKFRPEGLRW